jgi:antitoxin component YwqK of YwqJK toxin-antitoxin module
MKKYFLIYFLASLISLGISAQVTKSDTVNNVDAAGKKQGYWKKIVNDTLKYEGHFKDDKPIGTFTYYFPSGKVKAVSKFSADSKFCSTIMYFESGKHEAEGFYTNAKKDSVWKYYSDNDTLISEEHYKNCVKNGKWKFYYKDGGINEEVTWVNGVREGPWKMYYSDGKVKSECKISKGKIEGLFKYYYTDGKVYMSGIYIGGLKDGVWMVFNEKGIGDKKETYKNGYLMKKETLVDGKWVADTEDLKKIEPVTPIEGSDKEKE